MLDFAHDDRMLPRPAPRTAGRFPSAAEDAAAVSREAWVLAIRARVAAGDYLTDARLDGALDRLLDEALHEANAR